MHVLSINNVVDGAQHPGAERYPIHAPATGDVFATAPLSRGPEVDAAFDAARRALRTWRLTTPAERQERLLALAGALWDRADELAALEALDAGKPLQRVIEDEMPPFLDQLRFFAGVARHLSGVSAGRYVEGHESSLRREPVGVCALITPWNYPMTTAMWKWAPAIAAGNTVVIKPADATPASTALVAEIAAAHLPPGVFNVVCGDRETGRLLAEHPDADLVSLTGSVGAGKSVMRSASDNMTIVNLELGGKAPAVVFDDVDLSETADAIAGAAFYNAGQDCAAVTRVLVHESVAAEFVPLLVAAAESTRTGPDPDAHYGALISEEHLLRVSGYLDRLPDHARVLTGGSRADHGGGWFFAPTVVADVQQHDEIVQEEVFGPVVTVQTFGSEREALELANGTAYGLTASVWTNDIHRAGRMAGSLDSGVVWINTHTVFAAEMPHGGTGLSGHGVELSHAGFEKYTRLKHVMTRVAPIEEV